MKQRHSVDQINSKLRRADVELGKGKKVPEVCKVLEITGQTHYRRRQKYGGIAPEMAKELKAFQQENARLKKALANQALDMESLREAAKENWRAPNDAGVQSLKQRDIETALTHLTEALQGPPEGEVEMKYEQRGRAYHGQMRFDAAIADFTYALALVNDNPGYYLHRALAYRDSGNLEQAIVNCTSAIECADDPRCGHAPLTGWIIAREMCRW